MMIGSFSQERGTAPAVTLVVLSVRMATLTGTQCVSKEIAQTLQSGEGISNRTLKTVA